METVDEALKKGPRLCRVYPDTGLSPELQIIVRVHALQGFWKQYIGVDGRGWARAELVARREIEPFLGVE